MVLGHHIVLGMYGFWLPNDPRGSYSEFVWSDDLRRFGPATKVNTRRSVAAKPHDVALRRAAKRALKYPPVHLNGLQARAVGRGIEKAASLLHADIWACCVLPEHVHVVVARSAYTIEEVVAEIKQRVTLKLNEERLHPLDQYRTPSGRRHSPWARGFWKVFLDNDAQIRRAIRYVIDNPLKERKPRQRWNFVVPYHYTDFI